MNNKEIVRRVFEEGFNKGELAFADQIMAPNHVAHDPNNPNMNGAEGMKQIIRMYRGAFPDMKMTVDDQIESGDRVVTRWTSRGTHKGKLMEMAPTNKSVTVSGITIDRLQNGKIVESWVNWDAAGMMTQLTGKSMMQERPHNGGRASQPAE